MSKHRKTKIQSLWVMGRRCVEELARSYPERIAEVYSSLKPSDPLIIKVGEMGGKVHSVDRAKLTELVQSESHQSIVVKLTDRPLLTVEWAIEQLHQNEKSLFVALDSITDPQNVGAILRAAECFGVDGVIWSKNRGCSITPTVSKVSVGASEMLPLIPVSNLADSMKTLRNEGFTVIAADRSAESCSLYEYNFPSHVILILGAEGEGVRSLLKRYADVSLEIPLFGKIDSLNVSQAASVFLSEWAKPV